jgi:glycosyltransferase involved in cell wall biosynthesis
MLSILIPTYNYNAYPLAEEIHKQATKERIEFEIIVLDDGSTNKTTIKQNNLINSLNYGVFEELPKNIGRSKIRNLLAKKAIYNFFLFLDSDTMTIKDNYIENYIKALNINTQIIYGGIQYQKELPPPEKYLRWIYGKKREALPLSKRIEKPHLRFLTLNFIVTKNVFSELKFNEKIPNLRHEDTLYAFDAKRDNITVQHIENPVLHLGLETNEVFLKKSIESVKALYLFIYQDLIPSNEVALSEKAEIVKKLKLSRIITFLYRTFKSSMKRNLLSQKPSLLVFDFYRLGYYLQLDTYQDA